MDTQTTARIGVGILVTLAVLIAASWLHQIRKNTDTILREHIACMEDETCWDCSSMGNGICGMNLGGAK